MEEKYWEILLKKWRAKNMDGFSIPYIIGSQNYLTKNPQQQIADLIMEVANGHIEVYMMYCWTTNELILGIRDDSKFKIAGKFYKLNDVDSKLFQTKSIADLGDDLSLVIIELIEKYERDINKGNYSSNNRELGGFISSEVEFIQECFIDINKA